MYNKLLNKKAKLALVGLGYVGLPIALEFAKKISVIGFDINEERWQRCERKLIRVMSWSRKHLRIAIFILLLP